MAVLPAVASMAGTCRTGRGAFPGRSACESGMVEMVPYGVGVPATVSQPASTTVIGEAAGEPIGVAIWPVCGDDSGDASGDAAAHGVPCSLTISVNGWTDSS